MYNKIKKGDVITFIVAGLLIIISFSGLKLYQSINTRHGRIAVIRQDNKIIRKIDLDSFKGAQTIDINGDYYNKISVENGRIRFEEANCPDLVCVNTGWLDKNGQMAVCLPNKISIKIEGDNQELDGVSF